MAFAADNGEGMILFAETYGNCEATLCPSEANRHEAGNILKTKDRKRRFSKNEAGNMLKISQLPKNAGTQNLGDRLTENVDRDWYPKLEVK
jgi:hypothetical protein